MTCEVVPDAHSIWRALRQRAKLVLGRMRGLMKSSNALVQHFNPACRVARVFPYLPVSRFLLSLSDHDIPKRKHYHPLLLPYRFIKYGLFSIIYLPVPLKNLVVDWCNTVLITGFLVVLCLLGQSIGAAGVILVVLGLLLVVTGRELYMWWWRLRHVSNLEILANDRMFDAVEAILDGFDQDDDKEMAASMRITLEEKKTQNEDEFTEMDSRLSSRNSKRGKMWSR